MGNKSELFPQGNGKYIHSQPVIYHTRNSKYYQDGRKLEEIWTIIRRRFLVAAGVAITITASIFLWTSNQKPLYEGKFRLSLEPLTAQDDDENQSTPAFETLAYKTQMLVLRSDKLITPVIEEINKRYGKTSYKSLVKNNHLRIKHIEGTSVLEVRYRDSDPQKVHFVLKQLADNYINYSRQQEASYHHKDLELANRELPQVRQEVDRLEEELLKLELGYKLIDYDHQKQQLSTQISQIKQQQLDTDIQLQEAQSFYQIISQKLGLSSNQVKDSRASELALAQVTLAENPYYQKMLNHLEEVEAEIAIESSRYTPNSPTIKTLQQQKYNFLSLLRSEAEQVLGIKLTDTDVPKVSPNSIHQQLTQQLVDQSIQISVLQARQEALAEEEESLEQDMKQMLVIDPKYTSLRQKLTETTQRLDTLLALKERVQPYSWKLILKPKQPQYPIPQHQELQIILGAIAGILLGAGTGWLMERLDHVFHSPDELQHSTQLPLLGVIPYHRALKPTKSSTNRKGIPFVPSFPKDQKNNSTSPKLQQASPFLEAFRFLHRNIGLLGCDKPIQSIVISSARPEDGKSTVAVHLAIVAAAMGRRVLLVDTNLRRPRVHKIFGLNNQLGLSNVLSKRIKANRAIQQVPMWDHLHVLTAGSPAQDPIRLLCAPKMRTLMEHFNAVFDLVIYDTPPVIGLADSRLLAANTDGMVLVGRLNKTDRSVLIQALDELKTSRTNLLGIVANDVENYATSSYYHHQDYYTTDSATMKVKKLLDQNMR
ncbi:tyrosine-protein kinase family protein [Moorena sp. SIO4G3]|uniref:GumC family protein n=1 Tax=Moorena sp. SIO4G3 TaxID=2607821 RepID=UPI00142B1FDB|nr:tyrosine-protein kinase family protein [Moorena sp. SIO4G3]NEO79570.1 polysaccharide biosynthesis tyrosine autokinase [Moorena sp. SIO4G3]